MKDSGKETKDRLVVKYTRKIHPEDLGADTSRVEAILYELLEEVEKIIGIK